MDQEVEAEVKVEVGKIDIGVVLSRTHRQVGSKKTEPDVMAHHARVTLPSLTLAAEYKFGTCGGWVGPTPHPHLICL